MPRAQGTDAVCYLCWSRSMGPSRLLERIRASL